MLSVTIYSCQPWWYTAIMAAFRRLREEDHKFKASLGCTEVLSPIKEKMTRVSVLILSTELIVSCLLLPHGIPFLLKQHCLFEHHKEASCVSLHLQLSYSTEDSRKLVILRSRQLNVSREEGESPGLTLLCCLAHFGLSMVFSEYLLCGKHV